MGKDEVLRLLRRKFEAYRNSPFPSAQGVTDDEIGDLHGDLAEYDSYTGQDIARVLEKGRAPMWKYPQNSKLGTRIERLMMRKPQHSALLLEYKKEFDALQEMIEIVNRLRRES